MKCFKLNQFKAIIWYARTCSARFSNDLIKKMCLLSWHFNLAASSFKFILIELYAFHQNEKMQDDYIYI